MCCFPFFYSLHYLPFLATVHIDGREILLGYTNNKEVEEYQVLPSSLSSLLIVPYPKRPVPCEGQITAMIITLKKETPGLWIDVLQAQGGGG